jgi:hypothetical protein
MAAAALRQLLWWAIAAIFLQAACGAKSQHEDAKDLLAQLRSVPKPHYDPATKITTFEKHFVRDNVVEHGTYTKLVYNCTFADDQFVNLDDIRFGVTNVTCAKNKIAITSATLEAMEELEHALLHSETGLLYAGEKWVCSDVRGRNEGPIYR